MEGNNSSSSSYNNMENVGLLCHPMMIMLPSSHSHQHQHNNSNNEKNNVCSSAVTLAARYDHHHHHHQYQHLVGIMDHHQPHNINSNNNSGSFNSDGNNLKAKIMAHPQYPRLLSAYVSCQKVGAPTEVVARLEEAEAVAVGQGGGAAVAGYVGGDPRLDQFMEAYCEMLTKYEQELTKPFKEAMLFLSRIECQFKALTLSSPSHSTCAEDRELKGQLLRKYSGYLGSLRQEFLKKRKKGKLPKEARQQLLDWWSRHYKWPYPSESQKLALAESTGLDQKQINNWFINQRKRHWKPSEEMQFMVMETAAHAHHYGYMDNVLGNPYPMDISPAFM